MVLHYLTYSTFSENGLLSYENPNYHMDPARLADALNSNTELPETGSTRTTPSVAGAGRRNYAALDIGDMGVDVTTGPIPITTDNHRYRNGIPDNVNVNRGLDLTTTLRHTKPDLIDSTTQHRNTMKDNLFEKHQPPTTLLLNSTESPRKIPHVIGQLNSDIYAVPVKRRSPTSPKKQSPLSPCNDENLPAGWEKHEDNDGAYYWHIKSGTIQREPPESAMNEPKTPLVKDAETALTSFQQTGSISLVTRSNTSSALEDLDGKKKEELAFKRRSYPARAEPEGKEKVIRFAVRSLGWVEIAEEDLTPERSSKAVNKCIVDLSLGRNDLIDNVGRWGDGKDLFMDLDEGALKLIDPENLTVLNAQPIHTIRVWGVGRDNGRERDFAYVARDRMTRKHMCHVFRCDIAARTIANTLRDICKRIMIERSLQQNLAKPIDINGCRTSATRPTNLPTENRKSHHRNSQIVTHSFPTPMEEPRKVLPAKYVGCMQVDKASGMEALNTAIDTLTSNTPQGEWSEVNVAVAPSMITIAHTGDEKLAAECRVRYLSFLGIGKNVQQCAFIMHTAQDLFIAHVFHCEPSSGALCKTIEAACKLRYQKCLDAHPQGLAAPLSNTSPSKGIGATIKNIVGSLTGRKLRANSVES